MAIVEGVRDKGKGREPERKGSMTRRLLPAYLTPSTAGSDPDQVLKSHHQVRILSGSERDGSYSHIRDEAIEAQLLAWDDNVFNCFYAFVTAREDRSCVQGTMPRCTRSAPTFSSDNVTLRSFSLTQCGSRLQCSFLEGRPGSPPLTHTSS